MPLQTIEYMEYRQIFEKLKEQLQQISRRPLRNQSVEFIEEFSHLYLTALSAFSQMQSSESYKTAVPYCQKLLLQANLILYPEEQASLKGVIDYFWVELPKQLWKNRYYYLASFLLTVFSTVIGFVLVQQNFEIAGTLMPAGLRSNHELDAYFMSRNAQQAMLHSGREMGVDTKSAFAVFLMFNNIRVALYALFLGIAFAIPTICLLIENGLMMGCLLGLFWGGEIYSLGAWLLPHGVPEISAILFAGGAGLKLGFTLLRPESSRFWENVRNNLQELFGVVGLCVVLLIWAAIVESFVRQSSLSDATRYQIAGISTIPIFLIWLRAYLVGRKSSVTTA